MSFIINCSKTQSTTKDMKTSYNHCLLFGFSLGIARAVSSQIREPFNQLDLSGVSSQFFFPQTLHDYVVPTPNSYDSPLSSAEAAQIFYAFDVDRFSQ